MGLKDITETDISKTARLLLDSTYLCLFSDTDLININFINVYELKKGVSEASQKLYLTLVCFQPNVLLKHYSLMKAQNGKTIGAFTHFKKPTKKNPKHIRANKPKKLLYSL